MRVPRLSDRPKLALAEDAGEHGERRRQAMPQIAGVRVGARVKQQPGHLQRRLKGDQRVVPSVSEIAQGLPLERSALTAGGGRIRGQNAAQLADRGGRGGDVDIPRDDARFAFEETRRLLPPRRPIVGGIVQAGQPQERVGGAVRRHPIGEPAVPGEHLDVPLQPGPAREPVAPRDHQLSRAQRETRPGRVRVARRHLGDRRGIAGKHGPAQAFRLVAELFEVRLVGERKLRKCGDASHRDSFRMPAVRVARPITPRNERRPPRTRCCQARPPRSPARSAAAPRPRARTRRRAASA